MGVGHRLDSILESFSNLWDSVVAAACYTRVVCSGLTEVHLTHVLRVLAPGDSGCVKKVTTSVVFHGFVPTWFVGCPGAGVFWETFAAHPLPQWGGSLSSFSG